MSSATSAAVPSQASARASRMPSISLHMSSVAPGSPRGSSRARVRPAERDALPGEAGTRTVGRGWRTGLGDAAERQERP